jgi:hypothetical protein
MAKPDPELLPPIKPPRCQRCQTRMKTADVTAGPEGLEHRTYECSTCGYTEESVVICDPLRSGAVGWTKSGELKPPT